MRKKYCKIDHPNVHLSSDFEPEAILHSYKKSFNGFVIKLTEQEAEKMAGTIYNLLFYPNYYYLKIFTQISQKKNHVVKYFGICCRNGHCCLCFPKQEESSAHN